MDMRCHHVGDRPVTGNRAHLGAFRDEDRSPRLPHEVMCDRGQDAAQVAKAARPDDDDVRLPLPRGLGDGVGNRPRSGNVRFRDYARLLEQARRLDNRGLDLSSLSTYTSPCESITDCTM